MFKLLINEPPLQVLPSLAEKIGLNEAIVLQQVHYLLRYAQYAFEGKRWLYNSYQQWQDNAFRFWSARTIQRIFQSLEESGLIESTKKFNRNPMDNVKWYTVNYEKLNELGQQLEEGQEHSGWAMIQSTVFPDVSEEWLQPNRSKPPEKVSPAEPVIETPQAISASTQNAEPQYDNDTVNTNSGTGSTQTYSEPIIDAIVEEIDDYPASEPFSHQAQMHENLRESISSLRSANRDTFSGCRTPNDIHQQSIQQQREFQEAFNQFWTAGLVKQNEMDTRSEFFAAYLRWQQDLRIEHPYIAKFPRTLNGFAGFLNKDIRFRLDSGQLGFNKLLPINYLKKERWRDELIVQSMSEQEKRRKNREEVKRAIREGGGWDTPEGWAETLFFANIEHEYKEKIRKQAKNQSQNKQA